MRFLTQNLDCKEVIDLHAPRGCFHSSEFSIAAKKEYMSPLDSQVKTDLSHHIGDTASFMMEIDVTWADLNDW